MPEVFDSREKLGPFANLVSLVGALAIMVVAGAIVVDVLMRWLFNAPILGVDDVSQYNLAVIVTAFFPVCLVGGHFVTIRFLGRALGTKASLWLEVFGNVMTLLIFIVFAWQFLRFTIYDVTLTGLATVVLEIPQAPWWWTVTVIIYICLPIQLVVLAESVLRALAVQPRAIDPDQQIDAGA